MNSPDDRRRALLNHLRNDKVVTAAATLTPLTGGVSSDIYLISDGSRRFVVKQALSTLRVRDVWHADPSRNLFEQRYLSYVGRFLPDAVPAIAAAGDGYFVMEYFGPDFHNWKSQLIDGTTVRSLAARAGAILGRIHANSRHDPVAARDFDSSDNFEQLRVDPYFRTLARRIPQMSALVEAEAARLLATRECLVHGDFSPKNILVSDDRMVVLDCEVAWYGDPA